MKNEINSVYKICQDDSGINVGDTVRVLRKAKDYEAGWSTIWSRSEMDCFIGKTFIVLEKHDKYGFREKESQCWFPWFVLEVVKKKIDVEPKCPINSLGGNPVTYSNKNGLYINGSSVSKESIYKLAAFLRKNTMKK